MRDLVSHELDETRQLHESLRTELEQVNNQRDQLIARLNAAVGAIQALERILGAGQEEIEMTPDELSDLIKENAE